MHDLHSDERDQAAKREVVLRTRVHVLLVTINQQARFLKIWFHKFGFEKPYLSDLRIGQHILSASVGTQTVKAVQIPQGNSLVKHTQKKVS